MNILPKVSVIVPAYNVRPYIEVALASIANQTFSEWEALIVDDGSTDGTTELISSFCEQDSRFRLLSKPNGGLASARNYGIRQAKGKYIALLDGDDLYLPDKLATHVALLEINPEIGVVYSASQAIRDDGNSTWMYLSGKPVKSDVLLALLCKNFIGHGSNAVFHRCLIKEVGEFDETLRSCEDIDFWLRIAATNRWKFYRVAEVMCCYRVRPSGLTFNLEQMEHSRQRVIEAAYQRSPERVKPILATAYAYMYRYLARLALTSGDVVEARKLINRALFADASIFYRDLRSLLTLISVRFAPLAQVALRYSLGTSE